jgi:hypothetical protein
VVRKRESGSSESREQAAARDAASGCSPAHKPHGNGKPPEFGRSAFKEEAAAELAAPVSAADKDNARGLREDAAARTQSAARAAGWTALVLAILSLFVWPVLLGGTAAVVGYVAFRQGSRGLGAWSITLGLMSALVYLILVPLYYAIS